MDEQEWFKEAKAFADRINRKFEKFANGKDLPIPISIQKDPFEGPAIRDERAGDVRITLNTKEGMKCLHLFPRQARELLEALYAWSEATE